LLGANSPNGVPAELFTSGEARWLGVQAERQHEQSLVLLVSVPYALKAGDAQTLGGLPPSAFMQTLANGSSVLLATGNVSSATASAVQTSTLAAGTLPVTTAGGTVNTLAKFDASTDITKSQITDNGTNVGIGTSSPAAKLDVSGSANIHGVLSLPPTTAATATIGANSQPLDFTAASFNKTVSVNQRFRWQAEALGNNTTMPSGKLNLLFGSGSTSPAETGLSISKNGIITFASGQTFPGVPGSGTVTSVGLSVPTADFTVSGSPVTSSGTLNFAWKVAPTSANTTNAIVKRDASGNFSANAATFSGILAAGAGTFTGNVGIGTSTPSAQLTLGPNFPNFFPLVPGILISNPSGSTEIWEGKDGSHYVGLGWIDPDYARIATGGGQSLVLQEFGGNVGIGNRSPSAALDVMSSGTAGLRVANQKTGGTVASFGGTGDFQVDAPFVPAGRLIIKENGSVGVGTATPAATFEVKQGGSTLADAWTTRSSARFKNNIQPLFGSLATVEKLRGVSYDSKVNGKHDIGLIAEEVAQVVPEVVSFDATTGQPSGLDYARLTALLIEAVKQQQRVAKQQQRAAQQHHAQIRKLQSEVKDLQTRLDATIGTHR
jgi:hypothetical protein